MLVVISLANCEAGLFFPQRFDGGADGGEDISGEFAHVEEGGNEPAARLLQQLAYLSDCLPLIGSQKRWALQ